LRRYPAVLDHYKGRRDPKASCLMAVYMDLERDFADTLAAALPTPPMSYEHDGVCVEGHCELPSLDLPIAAKPFPKDIVAYARALHPEHDWVESQLDIEVAQLVADWRDCRRSLERGASAARARNIPFGRVLACCVEGKVVIPKANGKVIQEFDPKGRFWTEAPYNRDAMLLFARKHIHIFATVRCNWRFGSWLTTTCDPELPDPLQSAAAPSPLRPSCT